MLDQRKQIVTGFLDCQLYSLLLSKPMRLRQYIVVNKKLSCMTNDMSEVCHYTSKLYGPISGQISPVYANLLRIGSQ